jgi:hypothetical protein
MKTSVFSTALCAIALSSTSTTASAVDRLVPQQYSTIQAAINASVNGDQVIVSPGTYNEAINFSGKRITVRSTGGASVTTINASGLNRRVVQFTSGETNATVLDGFTIRGGNPTTGTLVGHGGGILCCYSSQPTILNCVVRDNIAELGGGIYMCLNASQTRIGNTAFCNNLCGSGYGFDIAQGFVDLGGVTACADCGCDPGPIVEWPKSQGGNGHFYQARMQPGWIGWSAARDDAQARGGHLVSISSIGEQQRIASIMRPFSIAFWIGLSQAPGSVEPSGGWSWLNASSVTYSNWGQGMPDNGNGNQHFGAMRLGGTWDDFREDGETYSNRLGIRGWIIEWSADCDGDGHVDIGQILNGSVSDANTNGVPDCCENRSGCCPGDVSRNAIVDGIDLAALLSAWGTNGQGEFNTDIDNDGIVSGTDLAFVLGGWGPCP